MRFFPLALLVLATLAVAEEWEVNFNNMFGGMDMMGKRGGRDYDDDYDMEMDYYIMDMLEEMSEPQSFLISTEAQFEPYNFPMMNAAGAVVGVQGFSVDVLYAAAKALDVHVDFIISGWSGCIESVEGLPNSWEIGERLAYGAYDACSAAYVTQSRSLSVGYSLPYAAGGSTVLVGTPGRTTTAATINTVAIVQDFASDDSLARELFPETAGRYTFRTYPSVSAALNAASRGDVDAAFISEGDVLSFNQGRASNQQLRVLASGPSPPVSMMSKRGAEILYYMSAGLMMIMADGTYDRICREYPTVDCDVEDVIMQNDMFYMMAQAIMDHMEEEGGMDDRMMGMMMDKFMMDGRRRM